MNGKKQEILGGMFGIIAIGAAIVEYIMRENSDVVALASCIKDLAGTAMVVIVLYSLIKEQNWLEEYQQGKPKKLYIKFVKKEEHPKEIILSEYVRHQIHHSENHKNVRFTRDELKESIEMMRTFIKAKHDTKDIVEPD